MTNYGFIVELREWLLLAAELLIAYILWIEFLFDKKIYEKWTHKKQKRVLTKKLKHEIQMLTSGEPK
jgi:hypothetical protein